MCAVCKKCPGIEINAIAQYVADHVRQGESLDLLVLKEMVAQMTGITLVRSNMWTVAHCAAGKLPTAVIAFYVRVA